MTAEELADLLENLPGLAAGYLEALGREGES